MALHNFVPPAEFPISLAFRVSLFYARFGWCHRSLSSKTAMQSWLQKQGWVWVAKFAGILRFYRKAVVLISATSSPPLLCPAPRGKRLSKIADEAREKEREREREREIRSRDISRENWRVPNLSPHSLAGATRAPSLRPAAATGLFNFVHKSVMEEPLQALPIRNEACRRNNARR